MPQWLRLVELSLAAIARVAARFPHANLLLPAATAADSETPCVCARQSDQRKITFWNSLRRDCQMTGRGSNLDSNLNSAA